MSLWKRLSQRFHSRSPQQARDRRTMLLAERRRPFLEELEIRRVMAGNIDTSLTPTELASALVGSGVSVSNVTFTGGADSTGGFSFSDPTLVGFSDGVLMSSGKAADVVGPNKSESTSTDFTLPGDANLDALSGFTTHDAAVLEFDFVPTANQVVFQYVFASDEYPEWVDTDFNDVFAFFVNGTNYAEVRQIAGDPSSPFVPVAVNNINNSNPIHDPPPVAMRPDLFRANYFVDGGTSPVDLELDGITKVLTFQAPVNPGETNHMKLAIADASDGVYDSAVFIQSGSLVSNENPVADLSLSPDSGAAPLVVSAIVEGEDPNGLALTYTIDWGDGTTSNGPLDQPPADSEKTALVEHTYNSGGSYIVTLTVSNGSLSSMSTEDIEVSGGTTLSAPDITSDPAHQSVSEGDLFTFSAAATGNPTPTVQWQVSTDGGLTFVDIAGAVDTSFSATASLADNGNQYQAVFTNSEGSATTTAALLTVTAVNHAPVLDNSLFPTLASIAEDFTGAGGGTLVSSLLAGAVTDVDAGALQGIAITAASSAHGVWQYSLDGGGTWSGMGSPSNDAALLLPDSAEVQFLPAANFNGQVKLWYRAWDQTAGTAGGTLVDENNIGGSHTMSTATENATLTVTPVNDAPVLNSALNPTFGSIAEDTAAPAGKPIWSLLTGAVNDVDVEAKKGIAVYGASTFNGLWQFKLNGGSWQAMSAVSESAALLLPSDAQVRFIPKADFTGTVKLYYRAWDQTEGAAGQTFDLSGHIGNTHSISFAKESAPLLVTPVNDKPVLSFSGTVGYVHDKPAITLAPYATVTDVDSPDFDGGRLRVRITDGAGSSNRLAIGSGFTVDGSGNVLQGTTIIGKRVANGFGTNELVITFNANATKAVVQQLVRAITFKTVGGAAGLRKVVFTVSDGDGGLSAEATKTVDVT